MRNYVIIEVISKNKKILVIKLNNIDIWDE